MARNFIPWGRLRDGKMGVLVETGTSNPLVVATEIFSVLPSDADADNFEGRCVYSEENQRVYVFTPDRTPKWSALEGGFPTVGAVGGNPPTVPIPRVGEMYYDTNTQVLFLWDGSGYWIKPGANYAAAIVTQRFTGNGSQTVFLLGTSDMVDGNYVEVFVDGVRCYPNPDGDYNVLGTSIVFSTPPAVDTLVMIRTLIARSVSQNAQISSVKHVATASQTDFDLPGSGVDPNGVFVFEDGVFRTFGAGADEYQIETQNTEIVTVSKISSTVAEITTVDPHSLTAGQNIYLYGTDRAEYNTSFAVLSVINPLVFRITVPSGNPNTALGNPTMYWGPPGIVDKVVFNTGRTINHVIQLRVVKDVSIAGSTTLGTIPLSTAASPGLYTDGSPNTGLYSDGAGLLGVASNGVSVVEFNNTGVEASTIYRSTDAVRLPVGLTAARPPTPGQGDLRGSQTSGFPEYYDGSKWLTMMGLRGFAAAVFDGTQANGLITTLAGVNIGSITKTGVGEFTVVFSTNFSTANYLVLGTTQYNTSAGGGVDVKVTLNNITHSVSTCYIQTVSGQAGVTYDAVRVLVLFLEF